MLCNRFVQPACCRISGPWQSVDVYWGRTGRQEGIYAGSSGIGGWQPCASPVYDPWLTCSCHSRVYSNKGGRSTIPSTTRIQVRLSSPDYALTMPKDAQITNGAFVGPPQLDLGSPLRKGQVWDGMSRQTGGEHFSSFWPSFTYRTFVFILLPSLPPILCIHGLDLPQNLSEPHSAAGRPFGAVPALNSHGKSLRHIHVSAHSLTMTLAS